MYIHRLSRRIVLCLSGALFWLSSMVWGAPPLLEKIPGISRLFRRSEPESPSIPSSPRITPVAPRNAAQTQSQPQSGDQRPMYSVLVRRDENGQKINGPPPVQSTLSRDDVPTKPTGTNAIASKIGSVFTTTATEQAHSPGDDPSQATVAETDTEVVRETYENGSLKRIRSMRMTTKGTYERHGVWNEWHENGKLKLQGRYEHDLATGTFRWWHSNGAASIHGSFAAGKPSGVWTWWFESGQSAAQGEFREGNPVGQWIAWDAQGNLSNGRIAGTGPGRSHPANAERNALFSPSREGRTAAGELTRRR